MAWQDRDYHRDRPGGFGNPLMWLLTGSIPLFTIFGIRVRAHAFLVVIAVLVLLGGWSGGSNVNDRVIGLTMLFSVILLHEFGHCFAARWMGGNADEILMTPLGGLAMTMAPRRPWPTFVTVAGGPLVNVVICLVCGLLLYFLSGEFPVTPASFGRVYDPDPRWLQVTAYLFWIYLISYGLLLFNLLPIFPLDGGQLLQAILWKPLGYYRSMIIALNVGIVGSILMIMVGIASAGGGLGQFGGLFMILIFVNCLINCIQMRAMVKSQDPWGFTEEDSSEMDYSASLRPEPRRRPNRRAAAKAERQARQFAAEQTKIDAILAKVSAKGMNSLSWFEKRALKQATERQRKRDAADERRIKSM